MSQIKESYAFSSDGETKKWEDYDTIVCPDGEVIDMQKLLEEQQRAAAAINHIVPSLGGLLSELRPVYTFRVDTQATDGYNILVNPQFTAHLDFEGKIFVMAHEVMHCLLNHLRRAHALGHPIDKANIAADYECNITIAEDLELVDIKAIKKIGALIDTKYHTWGYEKIYADNPAGPGHGGGGRQTPIDPTGSGDGGGGGQTPIDPDFRAGWEAAVRDYQSGKLTIKP